MLTATLVSILLALVPLSARADRDDDESGYGRHHRHGQHGSYKHEYWDGQCKVKVKMKKGDYKEERKCKGPQPYAVVPVHLPAPAPVVIEPGLVIHGTVVLR